MAIITGRDLAVSYGAHDVFAGVGVEVPRGARIALIGPNGCGKTSLLRLLGGLDQPTTGRVRHARGLRIGYLPQVPDPPGEATLYEELRSAFADLDAEREALQAMEAEIATSGDRGGPESEDLLERYDRQQQRFEARGGYEIELRIDRVRTGLGLAERDLHRFVTDLSGGQQTRAHLGRLLLSSPDALLLDEPTNHLDVDAIEWLESFLREWDGALVTVAHDRAFLDNVARKVWELAGGDLAVFSGNYTHYARQRAERDAQRAQAARRQQAEVARLEEFVRRNMAGQNTKQAQARQKTLTRMERIESRPETRVAPSLRLSGAPRSGDIALRLTDLVVGYGPDRPLLSCEEAELHWRGRVALIGPNGSGKTTLLRTILGEVPPLSGRARLGANVRVGYLSQSHERVRPGRTVLDHVLEHAGPDIPQARAFLGRYRFSGDDVFKDTSTLSGGERARVALALLELDGANLLLLDEPTNHLDIASQEALQEALQDFVGTVMLVTHDRYLVRAIGGHVWAIEGGELLTFEEGYDAYRAWREGRDAGAAEPAKVERRAEYEAQKKAIRRAEAAERRTAERRAALEGEVARLEQEIARLEQALAEASGRQDVDAVVGLAESHEAAKESLERSLAEWLELADEDPDEREAT